ncbi:MAG: hypothetical protein H7126_08540 [Candidatus Parcubacteria bacterium]|nr:hypothetical protein [Leptolyngbyaceae cyanobacterium LF-bin-113]
MKKYMSLLLSAMLLSSTIACSKSNDTAMSTDGSKTTTANSTAIAAGTTINTDLQQDISTGKNRDQEPFTLKGKNGSLKDATIEGHLEDVVKAQKGKKASLHLVLDKVVLKDGSQYPIDATLVNTRVESKTKGKFLQNAGVVLGGAVAGKFLGDRTKFKHGGLAGGAAATAFVLSSPGGEVVLKKGTDVNLKLKSPLEITP